MQLKIYFAIYLTEFLLLHPLIHGSILCHLVSVRGTLTLLSIELVGQLLVGVLGELEVLVLLIFFHSLKLCISYFSKSP